MNTFFIIIAFYGGLLLGVGLALLVKVAAVEEGEQYEDRR